MAVINNIGNFSNAIILFDGVCNLCNSSVKFIIKRDKNDYFRFVPLQSEKGNELVNRYGISTYSDSVILIEKGNYYLESTAALRIVKKLSGLWPILYLLIIIPKFIRNSIYRFIAKHRYSWFGKKDSCMVPTKELLGKFL